MKILLINTNPVVSRLLALCTRDEHMVLDEVKSVEAVEKAGYDIVFVDEAAYTANVSSLFDGLDIGKKVFFSYSEDPVRGFDIILKKPFLPSQIIKIIVQTDTSKVANDIVKENVSEIGIAEEGDENTLSIFPLSAEGSAEKEALPAMDPLSTEEYDMQNQEDSGAKVLNMDDIAKIKALLNMEEGEIEINEDALLEEDAYEERKIKVIKEQLIADGLEILEEDEIVEELSASVEKASEKLNKKLKKIKKRYKKKTLLGDDEYFDLEEALSAAIANLKPKKIKKLLNGEEIKVKIQLEDRP